MIFVSFLYFHVVKGTKNIGKMSIQKSFNEIFIILSLHEFPLKISAGNVLDLSRLESNVFFGINFKGSASSWVDFFSIRL